MRKYCEDKICAFTLISKSFLLTTALSQCKHSFTLRNSIGAFEGAECLAGSLKAVIEGGKREAVTDLSYSDFV